MRCLGRRCWSGGSITMSVSDSTSLMSAKRHSGGRPLRDLPRVAASIQFILEYPFIIRIVELEEYELTEDRRE
jgi:hypothetical protein